MRTGIDTRRRHTLALLGSLLAAPYPARAASTTTQHPQHLAAAWQLEDGSNHIGILTAPSAADAPLTILHTLAIPTRAHGLLPLADGSLIAIARRPGDWLLRWQPGSSQKPLWHWSDGSRTFNGHAITSPASADDPWIYSTETDTDTETSLIARRSIHTLEVDSEWPTHGIDAHELIWQGNSLIVANGGVPTAPETGRVKRNLERMQSSLVRLHGTTGALQGQWSLSDKRLSLRHLAWNPERTVLGIALQAEHDDIQAKNAAPVLALWDGRQLRTVPHAMQDSQGYGGSIAATRNGWAVSCPRAGGIAHFSVQGAWRGLIPLPDVCALAVTGQTLWAGGRGHSLQDSHIHPHAASLHGARLDNHWGIF